jgi:hypothetical protein
LQPKGGEEKSLSKDKTTQESINPLTIVGIVALVVPDEAIWRRCGTFVVVV